MSLKKQYHSNLNNPLKYSNFNNTFESDQLPTHNSHKFIIKKQLYNGIKTNDVTKIIGKTQQNQINVQQLYDQQNQTHLHLIQMRRKYDELKTLSNNKKNEIQLFKKQLENFKNQQQQLNQKITSIKKQFQTSKSMTNFVSSNCQNSIFNKDIYLSIFDRSKNDNLIIKKRLNESQSQLNLTKCKLKTILNEASNKKKISEQCRKMLLSMEKVVQFQKQSRQTNINSIYDILNKKQQTYLKKTHRQKQIEQVTINAMNQKTSQQKQWIKIYFANKLINKIFKSKIQRQLNQNHKIQVAFQNIKANTGVSQCDQFIQKFLNREQTYGQLLLSISQKEPKLHSLQNKNEQLKNQYRHKVQNLNQQTNLKSANINGIDYQKQIDILENRRQIMEKQRQQFYQFLVKFLKRYDSLNQINNRKKQNINYYQMYPRSKFLQLYKKFSQIINKILLQTTKKEQVVASLLLRNTVQDFSKSSKFLQRNTRIKTIQFQQKNQLNLQNGELFEDQAQNQYIQDFRRILKKDQKNRKFRIKTRPF